MTKIAWDKAGERYYETGVKNAVLYPLASGSYSKGVAWNGIISVTESPTGAEATPLYADDIKYLNLVSNEDFGATIEAYTYPDEFAECNGERELAKGVKVSMQERKTFGLSYKTTIGNDTEGTGKGYKLHLVYGCLAAPSEKQYNTINDDPEAITFSWEISTTPVECSGFKPTSHIEIDSRTADPTKLADLEKMLYGDEIAEAKLPLPDEVASTMAAD